MRRIAVLDELDLRRLLRIERAARHHVEAACLPRGLAPRVMRLTHFRLERALGVQG